MVCSKTGLTTSWPDTHRAAGITKAYDVMSAGGNGDAERCDDNRRQSAPANGSVSIPIAGDVTA